MSFGNYEANGYMHKLDLLIISHWLCVSYPMRSGCRENLHKQIITHANLNCSPFIMSQHDQFLWITIKKCFLLQLLINNSCRILTHGPDLCWDPLKPYHVESISVDQHRWTRMHLMEMPWCGIYSSHKPFENFFEEMTEPLWRIEDGSQCDGANNFGQSFVGSHVIGHIDGADTKNK